MIAIHIHGNIISGEFDEQNKEFYIEQVKSFSTGSVLNKNQFSKLLQYLKLHEDEEDGQIITLYDQMPILLSQIQLKQLISDLQKIQELYD